MRELRIAGLDLGGTNVRCGLVRLPGGCESPRLRALGTRAPDAVLDIVIEEIGRLGEAVDGVGIAVAGMVDADHRRVLRAPNLDWTDLPLADLLEARLGVPVAVLNDVNAITWGEYLGLGSPGIGNLAAVFFGTGVGGGLVLDGHLVEGARGMAMEIGHVPVEDGPDAPWCGCGRRGCLEAFVGGLNFSSWVRTARLPGPVPAHMGELDSRAAGGELEALDLVGRLAGHTARVLASAITLLDPGCLMVGGTVWSGCPVFSSRVRELVETRCPGAVTWLSPRYTIEAGILGAADQVRFRIEGVAREAGT